METKLVWSIEQGATGIKHTHTVSQSVVSLPGAHTLRLRLTRRLVVGGRVMMMRQADSRQNNQSGSESAESGCVSTGSVPRRGRSVPTNTHEETR